MSLETGLLWLLLPLAAWSGWYVARHGGKPRVEHLRNSYFRGLNYLLNEQPDKAIEVFAKIAELDSDTVEAHLALGSLFRRRGEVDRAIRVHQNLIAKPNLSKEQKNRALTELGEDYMRAGLLDRAESLFTDLAGNPEDPSPASRHLMNIYQQERDWPKAIEQAKKIESSSGEPQAALIAHFHCELAEQALDRKDFERARAHLQQSFAEVPHFARALVISARMSMGAGEYEVAIGAFERAVQQDVELVPEVLASALTCYAKSQQPHRAKNFLKVLCERYEGISPVLALAKIIEAERGVKEAEQFLAEQLRHRPSVRGLVQWLELGIKSAAGQASDIWLSVHGHVQNLLDGKSGYRCIRCGFGARGHHWQCPSCRSWGSIKPIHGVMGD